MSRAHAAPDVLVVHPGNARAYDMVAALAVEGLTLRFVTRYYHDPSGAAAALARLPGAARLERTLKRRHHPAVPAEIVSASLAAEVVARLADRFAPEARRERLAHGWLGRRAGRLVDRLRPRLVLAGDGYGLDAFRVARVLGIPAVLDQSTGFVGQSGELAAEERALFPAMADSLTVPSPRVVAYCRDEIGAADRILAPSPYVRDSLTALGVGPERIALVPYGVDLARFAPVRRAPDGRFRVLYVGRIGPAKGVHYLLEAFRAAGLADAELVLAGAVTGTGRWLDAYRGLYRHVPHVPHHEVHALFQAADAFVFPSLHEGMAVSVLEAMATGLPAIVTPNAGSPVIDGADGFVVPIRDAAAIRDRLRALHADTALRRRMGESARRRAEGYDLDRYARGLAAALRPLISSDPC